MTAQVLVPVIVSIFALSIIGITQNTFAEEGTVSGTVFQLDGVTPAEGVIVMISVSDEFLIDVTNAHGGFTIPGVPVGQRTIEAGDPSTSRSGSAEVSLTTSGVIEADIVLEPEELLRLSFRFPAKDIPTVTFPSQVDFGFNPHELVVLKRVPWKNHDTPSVDIPNFEFTIGQGMSMQMNLFIDRTLQQEDVTPFVEEIQSLAQIDPPLHRPPQCLFSWGDAFDYKCVLERLSVQYTKFLPDGTPVRAVMNVQFHEVKPADERLNSYTMKKHDALEMLDASSQSIPLLRSYQTDSFHDVVEQLFGDLADDTPPIDEIIIDDAAATTSRVTEPDEPVITKGFKIEISGRGQGQSEDNAWETVSGGSLNIEVTDSSVGADKHIPTPGKKFIDELTLKGPLIDKRKPISDWIKDGTLDKCNECKMVTLSFLDEAGDIVFENKLRVIDSYYFRNQVFLLSIQEDDRLHATVFDIQRTDSDGNQYSGPPRIFVVLPTAAPVFMPVAIVGSGFSNPTEPFFNDIPSTPLLSVQTKDLPLIGQVSELVTLVPPGAPMGQNSLKIAYLDKTSNPFPILVN